MLLTEIKRAPIKSKTTEQVFDPADFPDRFEPIGSGVGSGLQDSRIYLDKQHPSRVVKVVDIMDTSDSYLVYIRMVEAHQNNPFFPRIYGYKVYDRDTHYKLVVFMEKLVPLNKLDEDVAAQILSSIGIEYVGSFTYDHSLAKIMKDPKYREQLKQSTRYPKFKEALRLLEPLFKKYIGDLHIENLMVRLTSVGPQIVITDPLFPANLY